MKSQRHFNYPSKSIGFALALGLLIPISISAAENPDTPLLASRDEANAQSERVAAAPVTPSISSKPAEAIPSENRASDVESPSGLTCQLDSMVFAAKVENKMPEEVNTTFAPGLIYCWTRVHCNASPGTLKHVWTLDNFQREISMHMSTHSGRLWSHKQVTPGKWRVEVVTAEGTVAGSGTVEVK